MATQKAIIHSSSTSHILTKTHSIPPLRPTFILVKTVVVALNPADWKVRPIMPPGHLAGCDYAGIVEDVGPHAGSRFKKGDRVCGFAYGANRPEPNDGAFAEYIVVHPDIAMKIPDGMSFEEAASLGVGITTVGQGLYQSLRLAPVDKPLKVPEPILIYGGSSATGTLAIQFAKLSGYTVLTTCSPRNFDLVKSYGADMAFDYNDPASPAKIRAATNNTLKLAFDTISEEATVMFCAEAISSEGGEYSALHRVAMVRTDVSHRWTLGFTVFGEDVYFGNFVIPPSETDRRFAAGFWELSESLFAEARLRVHPVEVKPGGLQGVLEGLRLLEEGRVSGAKLVYNVGETP